MTEEHPIRAALLYHAARGSREGLQHRKFDQRRLPAEPTYREKSGKRALRPRPRHIDMRPRFHLSAYENSVLASLLHQRSKAADYEAQKPVETRVSALATAAALRCLGIERFMVLDIERHDGHKVLMLVTAISFSVVAWLSWDLDGLALRKDGTIGRKSTGICFTSARIKRRKLDGDWQTLRPRNKPEFRVHAYTFW